MSGDFADNWGSLFELFVSVSLVPPPLYLWFLGGQMATSRSPSPNAEVYPPPSPFLIDLAWAPQVSGLKLRVNIPDTAIIKEGRIIGWYYTNKEGICCRSALHEISSQALFQKLTGQQNKDPQLNPFGYVALAHFESGVSRMVKQHELQDIVSLRRPALRSLTCCHA